MSSSAWEGRAYAGSPAKALHDWTFEPPDHIKRHRVGDAVVKRRQAKGLRFELQQRRQEGAGAVRIAVFVRGRRNSHHRHARTAPRLHQSSRLNAVD